ncbi:MAG: PLP-dependent aspartate aminotransferase family protein [Clostridiales Family XIII bacterium]|jgi:cystathionine beta-lyase/cystathionine gamma-synthase|nr:PLP-dependent aspartate aminotransferase family protein [Clostridiales Family XIII bacterium]
MDFETLCIHSDRKIDNPTGAVATPIYQSATFAHPGPGESTGYDYSRQQNPTREQLEYVVAGLEGAACAVAFSSGMAAVSALMELFSPGDHIIAADDLYGGTHRLFQYISEKNGLTFSSASETGQIAELITPATKAIFLETPTNPTMRVFDIAEIAKLTAAKGILFIVDNTFLTPYFQKPLLLGADIVLHSGTKFLGGHNDTLAGFLAVKDPGTEEKLRFIAKTTGAALSPFDSFLLLRGIKTLAVRIERQQQSAMKIAKWLTKQSEVTEVFYPGLPSHSGFELSKKQTSGFGAMISFSVTDRALADQVLRRVQLIQFAESLGGAESLITYPMMQTHADIPEADRIAKGIDDRLLRLSVGLESAADLIADLSQALGK